MHGLNSTNKWYAVSLGIREFVTCETCYCKDFYIIL